MRSNYTREVNNLLHKDGDIRAGHARFCARLALPAMMRPFTSLLAFADEEGDVKKSACLCKALKQKHADARSPNEKNSTRGARIDCTADRTGKPTSLFDIRIASTDCLNLSNL